MITLRLKFLCILLFFVTCPLGAWQTDGSDALWPAGDIKIHLLLGKSPKLIDGTTYNANALSALQEWNDTMSDVRLVGVASTATKGTPQNGVSEVYFSSSIYGTPWDPNIAAVTVTWLNGKARGEADIILNPNLHWDAYRGPLRPYGKTDLLFDIRRTLLQQFGYLLGLGISETKSITNPYSLYLDQIETLYFDDKIGIALLYGFGVKNRPDPPAITRALVEQTVYVGDPFEFTTEVSNPFPVTYEWQKDSVTLPGIKDPHFSKISELSDAGFYRVLVRNLRDPDGAVATSRTAELKVSMPPPPQISTFYAGPVEQATTQTFWLVADVYSYSKNYTIQWYKDGVAIEGANKPRFEIASLGFGDAGVYTCTATNAGGSSTTAPTTLVVTPPLLPKFEPLAVSQSTAWYAAPEIRLTTKITGTLPRTSVWYKNGTKLPSFENSDWMWGPAPAPGVTDHYVIKATNMAGTSISEEVSVKGRVHVPLPSGPMKVLGYEGEMVKLKDTYVEGDSAQWFVDGVPIPGANQQNLEFRPAVSDEGKLYTLVASWRGFETRHGPYSFSLLERGRGVFNELLSTAWEQVFKIENRVHFLMQNPRRIEIYDLTLKAWLPAVPIGATNKMYQVSGDRIYFLSDTGLKSVDLAFQDVRSELPSITTNQTTNFLVRGRSVFASVYGNYGFRWTRFNLDTKLVESEAPISSDFVYGPILAYDPNSGAVTSRDAFNSLRHYTLKPDGELVYQKDLPGEGRVMQFVTSECSFLPGLGIRISTDGGVASLDDNTLVGGLRGSAQRVLEVDEGLLVLSGSRVKLYSPQLKLLKEKPLEFCGSYLAELNGNLTVFSFPKLESDPPRTQELSSTALSAVEEAQPKTEPLRESVISPLGIDIRNNLILAGKAPDFLYSRSVHSSAGWSPQPVDSLFTPLVYFPAADAIIGSSRVLVSPAISLSGAQIDASQLDEAISNASVVGDFLVVANDAKLSVFNHHLQKISSSPAYVSFRVRFHWAPIARKIYLSDVGSRTLVYGLDKDGQLTVDTSYGFAGLEVYSELKGVTPDGEFGILQEAVLQFSTLKEVANFGDPVADLHWSNNDLYLMQRNGFSTRISRRTGYAGAPTASVDLEGTAMRLFPTMDGHFVATTLRAGETLVTLLDADLNPFSHPPLANPFTLLRQPEASSISKGSIASLSVSLPDSAGPVSYQWYHDGKPIESDGAAELVIKNASDAAAGVYYCDISSPQGTTRSNSATLTVDADGARLANISTRSYIKNGEESSIVGFYISGAEPKEVLIRAAGPSLQPFGVAHPHPDPLLTLYSGENAIASNDSWGTDLSSLSNAFATTGAFGWPEASKDAAVLVRLAPGAYTAILSGPAGSEGVGLIEVYELDKTVSESRMLNLSTRSLVRPGENIQIAGLSVQGKSSKTILVRAAGPALANFGINRVLADPRITLLRDANVYAENDDWCKGANSELALAENSSLVGAFPFATNSKDAALLVTVAPGNYTIHVSGGEGSEGVALVEVYEIK